LNFDLAKALEIGASAVPRRATAIIEREHDEAVLCEQLAE
jgi:hypothetical protein